jgi:hypothetical protein
MKYLLAILLGLVATPCWGSQMNIVVVFDGSGSMGSRFSKSSERISKMQAAKKALDQMLNQLPPNTNVGVICFSGNVNGWLYKLGPVDKEKLKAAIDNVREGGGTPLGRYMKDGANALLELRAKQKSGVYKLVVVTDGESDDDIDGPLTGKYGILSKGLQVEAIGVDMSGKHTLATKVGYRGAENPEELQNAIKAVLAESTGKNDHSEDYDMIAPIPSEVAMAALQAISEFDNNPIGVKPKDAQSIEIPSSGSSVVSILSIVFGVVVCGGLVLAVLIFVTKR